MSDPTPEDIIAQMQLDTPIGRQDLDDLLDVAQTNPEALPARLSLYQGISTPADRSKWVDVGNALREAPKYLPLAQAILQIALTVAPIL